MIRVCKRCRQYIPPTHTQCQGCGCTELASARLSPTFARRTVAAALVGSLGALTLDLGCSVYGGPNDQYDPYLYPRDDGGPDAGTDAETDGSAVDAAPE